MFRYSLVLVAGLCVAGASGAATWADAMMAETTKDFGSVPRGPAREHYFRVVNKTRDDVSISNVRVSCGCVSASALKTTLKPGESTSIYAKMDTTRFTGPKTVTVFVTFTQNNTSEEVRLWVQANGRNDFTVSPDSLAFGQVKRGTTPTSNVKLTFYGHNGAKVTSIKGESNYILPSFKEVRRAGTEVEYRLSASLRKDTPVGKWYTDVWVKTNIAGLPQIRVPLTVEISSPLTISPERVTMGKLKVKGESERRVIVRGVKPFKITSVKGTGTDLEVKALSKEAREVHVLTIKFKGTKAGVVNRTLKVVTDLKADNAIDVKVNAIVE